MWNKNIKSTMKSMQNSKKNGVPCTTRGTRISYKRNWEHLPFKFTMPLNYGHVYGTAGRSKPRIICIELLLSVCSLNADQCRLSTRSNENQNFTIYVFQIKQWFPPASREKPTAPFLPVSRLTSYSFPFACVARQGNEREREWVSCSRW